MPFALEPHVAGELGPATDFYDRTTHPPGVRDVEYVLDHPDTDDLIESFPVYLVSERLAARLSEFPGLGFEPVDVRPGDNYLELHGDVPHTRYVRLLPGGEDAWLGDDLLLCVSDRLAVLRDFDLGRCDAEAR
jgi:hypothetical protein